MLTVGVRPYTLDGKRGFGITAGRAKWNAVLYVSEANAEKVCASIEEAGQKSIAVNVAYPAPFTWASDGK